MDLVPYLSAVILVSTIATIVLALLSYTAFKLRNRRKPRPQGGVPVFFTRVRLDGERSR
jgi:heme/copper-type cytochrome/quinol oxidase subunit 2